MDIWLSILLVLLTAVIAGAAGWYMAYPRGTRQALTRNAHASKAFWQSAEEQAARIVADADDVSQGTAACAEGR